MLLQPLIKKVTLLKGISCQILCEIVSSLFLCVHFNTACIVLGVIDIGPEGVKLNAPVFSPTGDFLIHCEIQG